LQQKTDWVQNKLEYRIFCRLHEELPLFFQDWWLDAVCDKGTWEVCLSKDSGENIQGVLPFYISRYYGFKVIKMPDLTPFLGIWLKKPNNLKRQIAVNNFEKNTIEDLIGQLPKVAYYSQKHPIQLSNWLPFYWNGFKQTTRYTFRIEHPIDPNNAYVKFKSNTRNKIVKAKKIVNIVETDDIELFYQINQLSFERQSIKIPYSLDFIIKLDDALSKRKQRKILLAKDEENRYHAAIYLIWDDTTIYNLMLGADKKLRTSGAVQLLLWEGIQLAAAKNSTFDFEGSMMQNIEPIFNQFGGKLTPYNKIHKGGNPLFRFLSTIKNG